MRNVFTVRLPDPPPLSVAFILGCLLMFSLTGCGQQSGSATSSATNGSADAPTVYQLEPGPTISPVTRGTEATTSLGPTCGPTELTITVSADRADYARGEPVALTVSARNNSESPCSVPTGSCIPQVRITDASGTDVWNRATSQVQCSFGPPRLLAPGETISQTVEWDGRQCPGRTPAACPGTVGSPATYRVTANWQSERQATTSFRIS